MEEFTLFKQRYDNTDNKSTYAHGVTMGLEGTTFPISYITYHFLDMIVHTPE